MFKWIFGMWLLTDGLYRIYKNVKVSDKAVGKTPFIHFAPKLTITTKIEVPIRSLNGAPVQPLKNVPVKSLNDDPVQSLKDEPEHDEQIAAGENGKHHEQLKLKEQFSARD